MAKLTSEQQLAVDKANTNIIVSAGAGSGKTTVLKERVLRELKQGVKVTDLIILTFTNNAAAEMRERIRTIINKNECVKDQAELVDSAYITTFDSFAQSLVKKYNYLLNMSKNFQIIDASIVNTEKTKILDDIFEEYYKVKDENFLALINDFCLKDDKVIREAVLSIYNSLGNVIDKDKYLDEYINDYYSDDTINKFFSEFEDLVFKLRDDIVSLLDELNDETNKTDKVEENNTATASFRYATSYDELLDTLNFRLAQNRNELYTEEGKLLKDKITLNRKNLSKYLCYPKKVLITQYLSTKKYLLVIIDIIKKIDNRLNQFKTEHNMYEFADIAFKAIELVENNEDVRNEIKNNTFEIMIDEYQDTNDIQEKFISLIENNNVYMVGDIKQSIYRFRNANPYIFKSKYDKYKNNLNGFKIDLNKNFRSRNEVINNINLIFNLIMSDDVGGADYKNEHNMIFGNTNYEGTKVNKQDYDIDILTYKNEDTSLSNKEVEAFIIADDINKKVNDKYQVIDFLNDQMILRDATYQDFVILIDKSRDFELVKKILESKGIPTTIDKDININDEDEIYILNNLIKLIIAVKEDKINNDFKHYFLSIARSYVINMDDHALFDIFIDEAFKETDLYRKCLEISKKIDALSNKEILIEIINKFKIDEKIISVGDIDERLTKLEYFVNNATNLNNFGMDIYSLSNYFEELLTGGTEIKMSINKSSSNSVKIMTIHKSKGLEFNVVYMPYLNSDFTKSGSKSSFKYSNNYGIITPYCEEYSGNTFISDLDKQREYIEELSERIRLFYVALTRAKEKIILIDPFTSKIEPAKNNITYSDITTVKSYSDLLSLIKNKVNKYIKEVNLDSIGLTKEYNLFKSFDYKNKINASNNTLNVKELNIDNKLLENKHFSKALSKVIDKDLARTLDFGTYMHYVFEVFDFKNGSIDDFDVDNEVKNCLTNFFKHEEVANIKNANIYKEYEIRFESNGATYHGFIDLLVEYDDHFDIIDYKLSNINSEEYKVQLNGYKDYIESRFNKPTNIYLYSIKKDIFKKLN